ncbi:hypothetical protein MM59RIKEN_07220 [Pusillibacter faecalis]|jgi:hypothetical protein|uniref:Uncharacterized protein n=1 Tax=Pusillibacter faecalis TaxID=2714358 RepID=A0A810QFW0_9FIRM|nr:hypothetical protein [Pusillibacter faecalis]BCK83403.1 hypothetical protein MM59RIKEN_07220 [Pusillibacter faecalis]
MIANQMIIGTSLPELSNPATAENLAAGKQAIDSSGEIITGTAEVCDMLANLGTATAADVAIGKTFTSADGVKMTGTALVNQASLRSVTYRNSGISSNIMIYYSSLSGQGLVMQNAFIVTPNASSGTLQAVQNTFIYMRYSSYLELSGNVTDMNAPGTDVRVYKVT